MEEIKENYHFNGWFRGEELWRTINKLIVIGVYSVLIFCILLFRVYFGYVMLGLFIFLSTYISVYENHLRKIANKEIERLKNKLKNEG